LAATGRIALLFALTMVNMADGRSITTPYFLYFVMYKTTGRQAVEWPFQIIDGFSGFRQKGIGFFQKKR